MQPNAIEPCCLARLNATVLHRKTGHFLASFNISSKKKGHSSKIYRNSSKSAWIYEICCHIFTPSNNGRGNGLTKRLATEISNRYGTVKTYIR